jgi:hypothetical protein
MHPNPTPIRRPGGRSTPSGGDPAHVTDLALIAGGRPGPHSWAVPAAKSALVAPDEQDFDAFSGRPFQDSHEFPTLLNTGGGVDRLWSPADRLRSRAPATGTLRPPAGVGLAVWIRHPDASSDCHSPARDANVAARLEARRTRSKLDWSPAFIAVAVSRFPREDVG